MLAGCVAVYREIRIGLRRLVRGRRVLVAALQ